MIVSATILAAGESSRMGKENKLLLTLNEGEIIGQTCYTVLNSVLSPVIVVTGYMHDEVERVLPESVDEILYNSSWESGMATSICAGISALPDDVDGNMIVMGDMPLVTVETLDGLVNQFCIHEGDRIVYPLYSDRQANPVIFPRKYFSEILSSKGDRGCKKVLKQYPDDAIRIPINSDEVILDCDTKDDYLRIISKI